MAAPATEAERRRHTRVPFAKLVEVRLQSNAEGVGLRSHRMDLSDLSCGGLRCIGEVPWVEPGTHAQVTLDSPGRLGSRSLELSARVLRMTGDDQSPGARRELTLEFDSTETPEFKKLEAYLGRARRAHERFDDALGHRSALADAFRMVCAGLEPAVPGVPRLVLVTSAEEGEGKSFTAVHLASALGWEGQRVLVVDADLRRPSVRGSFGMRSGAGLAQWLPNPQDIPLVELTQQTRAGLALIPAGNNQHLSRDVWTPDSTARLVNELRQSDYAHVILDAPPILASAEAGLLAAAVDDVLLVVRAGVARERLVKQAKALLERSGANLRGIILNDPQGSSQPAYLSFPR